MHIRALLAWAAMATATIASNYSLPCQIPFLMTPENRDILRQLNEGTMNPEGLGAATLFTNPGVEGSKPWPRGTDNRNTVTYCYDDHESDIHLRWAVENAMDRWLFALGGDASEKSGHNLVFRETKDDDGKPLYCRQRGAPYDWNPKVPWYTLSIEYNENQDRPGATTGVVVYLTPPTTPWTTTLIAGRKPTDEDMSHEIGHVLGFAHEHQRFDRDQWVLFKCENLYDFNDVWERVRNKPGMTPWKLCNDPYTAWKENFSGLPFIKDLALGGGRSNSDNPFLKVRPGSDYDTASIMHYSSGGSSKDGCNQENLDKCVLVKYKKHGDPSGGYEWIPRYTTHPSPADIAFVKAVYPWRA